MTSPERAHFTTGAVTIIFTDIQGYSDLEYKYGAGVHPALREHFKIFREAYAKSEGKGKTEMRVVGDAFFFTFNQPSHAVLFCVEMQRALHGREWFAINQSGEKEPIEMRVRMGIHAGEVRDVVHKETGQSDIFGTAVNKAARISAAAHGEQVLLSETVRRMASEQLLPPQIGFRDLGEHRLKGVGDEHIWQLLHPDLPSEFPPIKTLDARRHNLPLPVSPFLGRKEEIQEALEALVGRPEIKPPVKPSDKRFTVISGFGGMGKTRLAQQIAEEAVEYFEDGVWLVALENARTGAEMEQRIAEVLIQNLQPQPTIREQLWEFHRDRDLLLVLDNIEQVEREELGEVIDGLLQAGARIRILATSRRVTGLNSESVLELNPFSPSQSAALFETRAQKANKNFKISDANVADIAALCERLEGVPLAIEIAASRITLMEPRQMLRILEKQIVELKSTDPTLKPRQRALRGAVDWSYNLLQSESQNLFSQLAVFAGGFTIEAAIGVVCREDESGTECQAFDEFSILDSLLELRNQSLLRSQTDEATQTQRLSMLESVREYALWKLRENPQGESSAHRRHAEYFGDWAAGQAANLRTTDEAQTLCAFEREFDNLRAAFAWAQTNDALLCARLAEEFSDPLDVFGHSEEARNNLKNAWIALQASPESPEVLGVRGALRHALAGLLDDIGEKAPARALAKQSLELYQKAGDNRGAANALNLLAVITTNSGECDTAREYCENALKLWPQTDFVGRGKTLHNQGRVEQRAGDNAGARRYYEAALKIREQAGDEHGMAKTLGNMGTLAQDEGDYESAAKYYAQSLLIWRKLRHRCNTAVLLNNVGDLAALQKDYPRAIALLIHAQRIFEELKSPYVEESEKSLEKIKELIGEPEYLRLYEEARSKAWEDVV